MKSDPLIDAIRKVRHEISASFDHDPNRLVKYYQQLQLKHQERVVLRGGMSDHVSDAEQSGEPKRE